MTAQFRVVLAGVVLRSGLERSADALAVYRTVAAVLDEHMLETLRVEKKVMRPGGIPTWIRLQATAVAA